MIGSYPFTESRILSNVFAAALTRAGLTAEVEEDISSRELMIPALEQGVIDLVPEYEGTLTLFYSTLDGQPAPRVIDLEALLRRHHLEAAARAPAENSNELVVTKATAQRFSLRTISDLAGVSSSLVFGGPTECPSRPLCLIGLKRTYDLEFKQFQPIDTGGPLTLAALRANEIDVGLLFTTDPALASDEFVVLQDDQNLQPSEHVLAVLRTDVENRLGPQISSVVDAVSGRLTTSVLRELNRQVDELGTEPKTVAAQWLSKVAS